MVEQPRQRVPVGPLQRLGQQGFGFFQQRFALGFQSLPRGFVCAALGNVLRQGCDSNDAAFLVHQGCVVPFTENFTPVSGEIEVGAVLPALPRQQISPHAPHLVTGGGGNKEFHAGTSYCLARREPEDMFGGGVPGNDLKIHRPLNRGQRCLLNMQPQALLRLKVLLLRLPPLHGPAWLAPAAARFQSVRCPLNPAGA